MTINYVKVILMIGLVTFSGCGSSSENSYTNPTQKVIKVPPVDEDETDTNQTIVPNQTTIPQKDPIPQQDPTPTKDPIPQQDPTFATIKSMIARSLSGDLKGVTYISIGDSTRAYTNFDGYINHSENIFRDVEATLRQYNVKGCLVSEGGLAFETFLGRHYANDDRNDWINYMEAVDKIPGDGNTTIVNISMISNDFSRLNEKYRKEYNIADETDTQKRVKIYEEQIYPAINSDLKKVMKETITTLRSHKPKIYIMLTAPNPMQQWERGSRAYAEVYQEVADEMNLPYANLVKDKMPKRGDSANFDSWYGDHIHFSSDVGMPATAEYILEQILP